MDQNSSYAPLEPSQAIHGLPTADQARAFALMLTHGLPGVDAIAYFFPDELDVATLQHDMGVWMRSAIVRKAVKQVQGGEWHELSAQQQIQLAIDKHYSELAYFLYSNNYSELDGGMKQKADTARVALEAKLAGNAGKMDALSSWMDDIRTGRVKLGGTSKQALGSLPATLLS